MRGKLIEAYQFWGGHQTKTTNADTQNWLSIVKWLKKQHNMPPEADTAIGLQKHSKQTLHNCEIKFKKKNHNL